MEERIIPTKGSRKQVKIILNDGLLTNPCPYGRGEKYNGDMLLYQVGSDICKKCPYYDGDFPVKQAIWCCHPSTLHLIIKAKWYRMIEKGEKLEEYREDLVCWRDRFTRYRYDKLVLHCGYTSETMTWEVEQPYLGIGNPKWGAPKKQSWIFKLIKRLK